METTGKLVKKDQRYEFQCAESGIVVRGDYAEWVLAAASEVMANLAKRECDGHIDEMEALAEFGEADPIDLDTAKFEMNSRFEIVPQCTVTLSGMDYRWVAPEGRQDTGDDLGSNPIERLHDMSLTRNNSFLVNETGVDTSNN